mgnify:CR=1 FL=1
MRELGEVLEASGEIGRPFWNALKEGRIDLPLCQSCGMPFFFPRRHCPNCLSTDIGWAPSNGRGTVFAITVARVPFPGMSDADIPLATGLVDLEEGVRIPARFDAEALPSIGQRVVLGSRRLDGFPVFMPVEIEE